MRRQVQSRKSKVQIKGMEESEIVNRTDVSKKYMDISSNYRNRNLYPNPCEFSVPIFPANKTSEFFTSTYANYEDLIDDATPISNSSKPINQNVTGYSPDSLHIQLDAAESTIPNFYVGTTIEIDGDFRNVVYYNEVTKQVTIESPFVAIPPPGRPYLFRRFKNFITSEIAPVNVTYVSGQQFPIVNKVSSGNTSVSYLSILTSNARISKSLYLNSIVRFLNGLHREQTTSIVEFTELIPKDGWSQPTTAGSMELISYYDSKGLSFVYSGVLNYYVTSVQFQVFMSQQTRLLLIEIISGNIDDANDVQYYRFSYELTILPGEVYTQKLVTIPLETPIVFKPNDVVNIFVQDISNGGNYAGFMNLVGSLNPNVTVDLFGFNSVPYLAFIGNTIATPFQQDAFGNNCFASFTDLQTVRVYSNSLYAPLDLNMAIDTFDQNPTLPGVRWLLVVIVEGQNITSTPLYTNYIPLLNTNYIPSFGSYIYLTGNVNNSDYFRKYWMYSFTPPEYRPGIYFNILENGYNDNNYPCTMIVPNQIDTSSFIKIILQGTTVGTPLNANDIVLNINNTGSNSPLVTLMNAINESALAFTIEFKLDLTLDITLVAGQMLDFIFGINGQVEITNFDMTIQYFESYGNNIELYPNTVTNITGAPPFTNLSTVNTSYWLYNGILFNALPLGYNDSGLSYSFIAPPDLVKFVDISILFTGIANTTFSDDDVFLKLNNGGTDTTYKYISCPASNTINFSYQFDVTFNDGFSLILNQQLDIILGIRKYGLTLSNTQMTVKFRYVSTAFSVLGNDIVQFKPDTYYSIMFGDVTDVVLGTSYTNDYGFINFHGYTIAPEQNNLQSLISADFRGFIPSLQVNAIEYQSGTYQQIWNNFPDTDIYQYQAVSTSTEQGFLFVPDFTGNLTSIALNLMSFAITPATSRQLQVQIRSGFNLPPAPYGAVLANGSITVNIVNTNTLNLNSNHCDYLITFPLGGPAVVSGQEYTITVLDVSAGANTTGYSYIYGIKTNYTNTRSMNVFPRYIANPSVGSSALIINNSMTNQIDQIPTASEVAFEFSFTQDTGVINPIVLSLFSYVPSPVLSYDYTPVPNTLTKDITIRFKDGATVLYQRTYTLENILEPSLISIFLTDLSLNLTAGTTYTLTLQDTSGIGSTWFQGIAAAAPYFAIGTSVYPLMYLSQISYFVKISPAMSALGFLNNGTDEISFNSLIRENVRPLQYQQLPFTEVRYFEVRFKHLIMPNKVLAVGNGGNLINYPFFFVEIFNQGDRGTSSVMLANSPNQNVIFKVYITRTYYDQPTQFYVLKTMDETEQRPILMYRPDKDTYIRILMPDGQTVVKYQQEDDKSPFAPNPLLQISLMLSLRPVRNYKPLIPNQFVSIEEL